ncbi:hypothetical protein [Nonomuraea basaltis]|uniref:hypothetical protein n=1 Tax=Nonomuraea basaltis TaxID=2495887 RepID=UPI001486FDDA|nr:hypothetical protein [Nonomuraea basaltis]
MLAPFDGVNDQGLAVGLAAAPHARWSVVYDLTAGTARLVTGQRWDRVHTIRLS